MLSTSKNIFRLEKWKPQKDWKKIFLANGRRPITDEYRKEFIKKSLEGEKIEGVSKIKH